MHVEQVYRDFNGVTLAYRIYRLNIWSINQLRNVQIVEFKGVLKLLELLQLLLFILMHPHYSACPFRLDVHLVIGAILGHASPQDLVRLRASLLAVRPRVHIVGAFSEFILETGH